MDMIFGNCYKDKRVLVTGHTGFKGSWLIKWLELTGAKVTGYALEPPSVPNHFSALKLKSKSIAGDINDFTALRKVFAAFKPEIVFHLAAQALVIAAYKDPLYTYRTNIIGTANVLEACRQTSSVKVLINVTSDKCYENRELDRGYRESDTLGGTDPYSSSKSCAELITLPYQRSSLVRQDLRIATVRAGNVIGGGDWAEYRIIPDLVRSCTGRKPIIIRNPQSIRPWQHVLEALSGYLMLGWKLLSNENDFIGAWNFGPDENGFISVLELAERFRDLWSDVKFSVQSNSGMFSESACLKLDCSKARRQLEWNNTWDSARTIEKTVLWYKNFITEKTVLTESDITGYVNDAKQAGIKWIQ